MIIDNYIDRNLLKILSKIDLPIFVITSRISKLDIEKYQYTNVFITISKTFHDRFIILDKEILYHCGASFKDLRKKCFAINKTEDKNN